jgi:D-amino-acid dehydrogenase
VKVLVLGAGVIGTAASWYLAEAGHEVEVIDRRDGAGLETSFANGGQVSACHAEPWANPGVLPKMLHWLGRDDAPLVFRWGRWDPALWAWGLRFLGNCRASRAAINTERTLRIALYSRRCLQELRAATGLDYDQRSQGILHVYRDPVEFDHARAAAALMRGLGLPRLDKTAAECVTTEPALAAIRDQLVGGIHTPDDESGDAHKFTRNLAALGAARGIVFHANTTVQRLERDGESVSAVVTDRGRFHADAIVLALGSWSPLLARPAGLRLPIVPAKGYSITVPVGHHHFAPTVSITDDEHKIVCSRLGDRLRVAGTAEMAGWDPSLNPRRWQMVLKHARALFPDGGDWDHPEPWAGLRPVTPDSVPLLGPTPLRNLWLSAGHGTLGWTMACGSGRIIADMISGRRPEISVEGLTLERFRR